MMSSSLSDLMLYIPFSGSIVALISPASPKLAWFTFQLTW